MQDMREEGAGGRHKGAEVKLYKAGRFRSAKLGIPARGLFSRTSRFALAEALRRGFAHSNYLRDEH